MTDPALLVDEGALHDGDLSGGAPKVWSEMANQGDVQLVLQIVTDPLRQDLEEVACRAVLAAA